MASASSNRSWCSACMSRVRFHPGSAHRPSCSISSMLISLDHFHPRSRRRVGATAHPSLSGQEACSHEMSIEEIEHDGRCADPGWNRTRLMHAEHQDRFNEAYAMCDGDPTVPVGGFRKLREWFRRNFRRHGWIFYGADGSGATLHWHAAALNILYVGRKKWRVRPPRHRGFTGMTAQGVRDRIQGEPFALRCLQPPGDLFYIPDHWGHMTINHRFGIGVAAVAKQDGGFLPGHVGKYNGTPPRRDEGGDGAIPRGAVDPHPKPPPGARRGHEGIVRHRHGAAPRHGPPPFGGDDDGRRGRRGEHTPLAHRGRAVDPAGRRGGDGGRCEGDAPDIPFFLVHINKTGVTSPIRM